MTAIEENRPFTDLASRREVVHRSMRTIRERWNARQTAKAARRELRRMIELDDQILEDLGLTRADIAWAANLPLHLDANDALRIISDDRRRASWGYYAEAA